MLVRLCHLQPLLLVPCPFETIQLRLYQSLLPMVQEIHYLRVQKCCCLYLLDCVMWQHFELVFRNHTLQDYTEATPGVSFVGFIVVQEVEEFLVEETLEDSHLRFWELVECSRLV